jgi:diamine N-acetyltransferase
LPPAALGFAAERRSVRRTREIVLATSAIELRATREADLGFVLEVERHPDNASLVGQWSREEHATVISRPDREHWVIAASGSGAPVGYLIAYDLTALGCGVYVKRIVVAQKGGGLGRKALGQFAGHAFGELSAPYVWLAVYPENVRGQHCYRAVGFRPFAWGPQEQARHNLAAGNDAESRALLMVLEPRAVHPPSG